MNLAIRNLAFYWRTNLAIILGVVAGAAALTGALLVGDSLRGSLREHALARLGDVDLALIARTPFQVDLAERLSGAFEGDTGRPTLRSTLLMPGSISHATTRARANRVAALGVIEPAWALAQSAGAAPEAFTGRSVILNHALAETLNARIGDDVLLRIAERTEASPETLLGRRDAVSTALRLTVVGVLPPGGLGDFDLRPSQRPALNAFVPNQTLARAAKQLGKANLLLVSGARGPAADAARERLGLTLQARLRPGDYGLRVRPDDARGYISVESETMLLEPPIEKAVTATLAELAAPSSPVISYLANEIRRGERSIPYSTVAGLPLGSPALGALPPLAGNPPSELEAGGILLNRWAAEDLGASPGDRITLSYYLAGDFGELRTESSEFKLSGVVDLAGAAADPGYVPEFEGLTNAKHMSDWDPPFPVDLKKVRSVDDEYWTEHRTTPKAFVTLDDAERLWATHASRFGRYTSIRLLPPEGETVASLLPKLEAKLAARLSPEECGLTLRAIRAEAIQAAETPTDFGGLFIGFSLFLIVAAATLVALLYRLGVERRSVELGTLLALGFTPRAVLRGLLCEGALLTAIGVAIGLVAAAGYAWLMLAGLRTWWSDAAQAPFVTLHATAMSFAIGATASMAVALLAIWRAARGVTRIPPRTLLAGSAAETAGGRASARSGFMPAIGLAIAAVGLAGAALADAIAATIGFFGAGVLLLMAAIVAVRGLLVLTATDARVRTSASAIRTLALRNAARSPRRSVLTVSLLASAVFLIISLGAFDLRPDAGGDRKSGVGGFPLYAESTTPILIDLNSAAGRERINAGGGTTIGDALRFYPFRLRGGDAVGCQNLYQRGEPRILGATDAFIERGGFRFAGTIDKAEQNPWKLLTRGRTDGTIPVIGDEAAVRWQLHKGLGDTLTIRDERGEELQLRFVALLSGSVLQDELIVGEEEFKRLFPSRGGFNFFLIESDAYTPVAIGALEAGLADFGFDVGRTVERLAGYLNVQNTYLRSFQTLGGFGLILGSIGLTAVMLRNVWERRRELALLAALGFRPRLIGWLVLLENLWLVVLGLAAGVIPALVAVATVAVQRPAAIPWLSLAGTLVAVIGVVLVTGWLALRPVLKERLIGALRSE